MHCVFRCAIRAAIVASFMLASLAQAQITDINSAINKASRERTLSHRMAKAYFQIGLGVDIERSKRVLDASISLFDRQLVELKNYAPTPEIKDTYKEIETAWIEYKDFLVGAVPSQETGKKVLASSEKIQLLAAKGSAALEKAAGTQGGSLVRSAGRIRTLSQRMAKFYQAMVWKVGNAESEANLESSRKEFVALRQELSTAPTNTQPINDGLELVKQQWFFLESALGQRGGSDRKQSTNVATASEIILDQMETVVGLYERLPQR
jgi:hypothetical protein